MPQPLTDRVVLITGASAGIGEAVALAAAQQNPRLVLASRREGVLQTIKDVLEKQGVEVLIVPTDMGDPDQVNALAEKALERFGQVDILVNNAGYGQMGPIEEVPEAAVRQQFAVNVFGLLGLTRALLPSMRQRGQGRILNISSVAGQISMPFSGIYNASKHAVEAISDALRVEVAPFGIQVVIIEPGPVTTDFFRVARETTLAVRSRETPYQSLVEGLDDLTDSVKNLAWPVDRVAKQILKAMTDDRPAARYTAFSGGKLGLGFMRAMPAALADRMWTKAYRIGSPPA
ncbi:MAG: SDR family oxidoreductase [Cyanobacteriota bacterium]|nr:SDR family oxidoreductase [Cyanobacteriota bacterium]